MAAMDEKKKNEGARRRMAMNFFLCIAVCCPTVGEAVRFRLPAGERSGDTQILRACQLRAKC